MIPAGVSTPDRPLVYQLPCFVCRQPFTISSAEPHVRCATCRGGRTMQPRLQKDDVLAALDVDAVLAHYGIRVLPHGRWRRGRACPDRNDHDADAFGVSPEGKWACHACQTGGDLLTFVARAEGLDPQTDFAKVLEVAAKIAGVVAGDPPPVRRAPAPTGPSLDERIAQAKKKAAWLWGRCLTKSLTVEHWLKERALDPEAIRMLTMVTKDFEEESEIAFGPIAMKPEEIEKSDATRSIWRAFGLFAVCLPVRSIRDGSIIDVRRRAVPRAWFGEDTNRFVAGEDVPKIMGMLGGVTSHEGELVGCYGRPHEIDGTRPVVVAEGWADYLTARLAFTEFDVLGAVDAGQYAAVAAYAANVVAAAGATENVILLAQNDPPRLDQKTQKWVQGASARALEAARALCLRRLPIAQVPIVVPKGCKDANEVAQKSGLAEIRRLLLEAIAFPEPAPPAEEPDWMDAP